MSRECCGPDAPSPTAAGPEGNGTGPGPGPAEPPPVSARWWRDRALLLPATAGVLWLTGLVLDWRDLGNPASVAHVLGLTAGAWTFVPGALRRLHDGTGRGRLGVGLLMTIAAAGAVALGHVGEAAALAFLFSLAETLEDRAMDRARSGLRALLSLIPETAHVARPTGPVVIPAAEVRTSDVLVVGAGERITTDGIVVDGRSWADTSAITGESVPVDIAPGDTVPAGAVNGAGTLHVEATADGRDNSLTRIVHLVEQAHAAKGDRARLADRIARPLVPAVLVAAALVAGYGLVTGDPATWTERALVVLVAASPCALAIAVPVTVISAIGAASRLGVVIKSGHAFEQLGTITHVAFDKTGTLTRNQPEVVDVHTTNGHTEAHVVRLAAALEASSSHPLATAITTAAADAAPEVVDVHEEAGSGLSGLVDGRMVRVGSPRWLDVGPLAPQVASMAARGMSVVAVEADGSPVGVIGIRDEPRPEAAEAIGALSDRGISTSMLTGDDTPTARALAEQMGITDIHAEQLPADKAQRVRQRAGIAPVAMVGDGINDAPALASATVGIAMGATGTAVAVESSDVAFTGSDLRLIPRALAHARRSRRIMTANIALALAIIAVLFPLALLGVLGLAAVVLVHEIAEVVVILNGLRAARTNGVLGPVSGLAGPEPGPRTTTSTSL